MPLTPVIVRGKRKAVDKDGNRLKKKLWRPPNRKRLKSERELCSKTDKRFAIIERLPAEILQQIFLLSENLNFPRSSLLIGHKLSPAAFRRELVLTAFEPTWDEWFGLPVTYCHEGEWRVRRHDSVAGNADFQTQVLACEWVTFPMMLGAKQVWNRLHGRGRVFDHALDFESRPLPAHNPGGTGHCVDVLACFQVDWDLFLANRKDDGVFWHMVNRFRDNRSGYIDVAGKTRIPDRLLKGPFDWDKAKFLFWLIHGGARLRMIQSWELTKIGYENILRLEDDEELATVLLRLFVMLNAFVFWPRFMVEEKLEEAKMRCPSLPPRIHSCAEFACTNHSGECNFPGPESPKVPKVIPRAWRLAYCIMRSYLGRSSSP